MGWASSRRLSCLGNNAQTAAVDLIRTGGSPPDVADFYSISCCGQYTNENWSAYCLYTRVYTVWSATRIHRFGDVYSLFSPTVVYLRWKVLGNVYFPWKKSEQAAYKPSHMMSILFGDSENGNVTEYYIIKTNYSSANTQSLIVKRANNMPNKS